MLTVNVNPKFSVNTIGNLQCVDIFLKRFRINIIFKIKKLSTELYHMPSVNFMGVRTGKRSQSPVPHLVSRKKSHRICS